MYAHGERERDWTLWYIFYKDTNSLKRSPPSWFHLPQLPPKGHSSNTLTLVIRVSMYEFEGAQIFSSKENVLSFGRDITLKFYGVRTFLLLWWPHHQSFQTVHSMVMAMLPFWLTTLHSLCMSQYFSRLNCSSLSDTQGLHPENAHSPYSWIGRELVLFNPVICQLNTGLEAI